MPPRSFCKADTFMVPVAIDKMINGQACSLHKRVHNDRTHEPKSTLHQVLA